MISEMVLLDWDFDLSVLKHSNLKAPRFEM